MGMQTSTRVPIEQTVVETIRQLLEDQSFQQRHRRADTDFTRRRELTFENVVVFLLQKTVRSIQAHLHDFFDRLGRSSQAVTPSAWCQARWKLKDSAFIELNQRAILDLICQPENGFEVRRWKGFRLIGIDSSLIRLPNQEAIGQEFGWVECVNNQGECGRYPQARLSALTDLLNQVVVEGLFVPWSQGERQLAVQHLASLDPQDIAILDRGYCSHELFAHFQTRNRWFVCRCPRSSFAVVNRLFEENREGRSVVATLRVHHESRKAILEAGLPEEITVRFVTVRLSTGELEVLATNLMDETLYPTSDFGPLYHFRWGIETYYGRIKGRLDLENFTGLTPEAVRQDVHSTLFLCNLESVLARSTGDQVCQRAQSLQHPQQINHAVCFHALKSQIIALLVSREPIPQTLAKLRRLFAANPISVRPNRRPTRRKQSAWRSYHYQRNTKKCVF